MCKYLKDKEGPEKAKDLGEFVGTSWTDTTRQSPIEQWPVVYLYGQLIYM